MIVTTIRMERTDMMSMHLVAARTFSFIAESAVRLGICRGGDNCSSSRRSSPRSQSHLVRMTMRTRAGQLGFSSQQD
jgi:hypothetical protein